MTMKHRDCVSKLRAVGIELGFHATHRSHGKMYHMGNPDCVWYFKGRGAQELAKIARGDRYKYLPFVAFEVAYSESEKQLRGSLMTLQLTNAAASVIVLLGASAAHRKYLRRLIGRYSYLRFRIWTEEDVNFLYDSVFPQRAVHGVEQSLAADGAARRR
ncbi:MAG: hypothetical protein N2689_02380 [Verrucomicrobiae bacterium]|nr:hypothetical protein [Verrucomicrobiae bacterium]